VGPLVVYSLYDGKKDETLRAVRNSDEPEKAQRRQDGMGQVATAQVLRDCVRHPRTHDTSGHTMREVRHTHPQPQVLLKALHGGRMDQPQPVAGSPRPPREAKGQENHPTHRVRRMPRHQRPTATSHRPQPAQQHASQHRRPLPPVPHTTPCEYQEGDPDITIFESYLQRLASATGVWDPVDPRPAFPIRWPLAPAKSLALMRIC